MDCRLYLSLSLAPNKSLSRNQRHQNSDNYNSVLKLRVFISKISMAESICLKLQMSEYDEENEKINNFLKKKYVKQHYTI